MEDKVQELLFELEKVMNARLDSIDCRLDSMSNRLDSMSNRLDSMSNRLDSMSNRFDSIIKSYESILMIYSHELEPQNFFYSLHLICSVLFKSFRDGLKVINDMK